MFNIIKKYLLGLFGLLFLCLIFISFTGCANSVTAQNNSNSPETEAVKNVDKNNSSPQEISPNNMDIDVDLTVLSGTMVYAEVYNIMIDPEEYMGKIIKMNGSYSASYYDGTGLYYHYVIIEDATACCAQGLEFIWNGEHSYPDDYPEAQTKIEVVGVFGSYDELGITYYYLLVDDISIKK
jgi:hypothetical protein